MQNEWDWENWRVDQQKCEALGKILPAQIAKKWELGKATNLRFTEL